MSNVIALERGALASALYQDRRPEFLDSSFRTLRLEYDSARSTLWTNFSVDAPSFVSANLLEELLTVCKGARSFRRPFSFRVLASDRPSLFCLGGDLALFRYLIKTRDREGLLAYGSSAVDAVYESVSGSGHKDLTSIALVQGEAQGGGFEAALASHILVAEKGVRFGFPEPLFGLFPGMGGYALIRARTDESIAKRLIGSTERYSAELLFELGVVDKLAEKGQGRALVNEIIDETEQLEFEDCRNRFEGLSYDLLLESVGEWVDQALSLSNRNLRAMGYLLQAQRKSKCNESPNKVELFSKRLELTDLTIEPILNGGSGPLILKPRTDRRISDSSFKLFLRGSRPWIDKSISHHGALIFRGFGTGEASLVRKVAASLFGETSGNAKQHSVSRLGGRKTLCPEKLNAWQPATVLGDLADCTRTPVRAAFEIQGPVEQEVVLSCANSNDILESLDSSVVKALRKRGVRYSRIFSDIRASGYAGAESGLSWQEVFGSEDRGDVNRICYDLGLYSEWQEDNLLEVWNDSDAIVKHPHLGIDIWSNQIVAYANRSVTRSLFSRRLEPLFTKLNVKTGWQVTFSDGGLIPLRYLKHIASAHQRSVFDVTLQGGDVLVVDNLLFATQPLSPSERMKVNCLYQFA